MNEAVHGEIVDNDAIEIGQLYQKAGHSLVDSVKYLIECGQRLTEKKASMKHGQWLSWLEDNAEVLGFSSRRTASMLMKAAANGQPASHLSTTEAAQISRQIWGHAPANYSSETNEWYTPAEYLDVARDVLGGFDPNTAKSFRRIEQGARRDYRQRFFWRRGTRAPQRAPDLGAAGGP